MKRIAKHLGLLCLVLGSACNVGAGQTWAAIYTKIEKPAQIVITNQVAWQQIWNYFFQGQDVSAVNFESNVVVCVLLGTRPTGGWWVEFGEPFVRNDALIVPFSERKPTGIVTEALTQPCGLTVIAKRYGLAVKIEKVGDAPRPDTKLLATANTEFALNLFARLRQQEGNLFFSSYSSA
jgi:hypothetical protein